MPGPDHTSGTRPSRLQSELRQTRPFRAPSQEALLALLRTADMAKRRFATLFEDEDVTLQQYNVLRILRGAGEQGLPTLEIGNRMIERTPGVTRIVDRLEAKGWVTRDRDPEDRRRVWCRLSPAGRELLARFDEPVKAYDVGLFRGVPAEDVDELVRILDLLRQRLATHE